MPDNTIEMPSMEPMHQAVGHGIQAFANVEAFLAKIFSLLLHPAPGAVSLIALDSARHIEAKLRMTRAVGSARLTRATLPEFNKLMDRIKDRTGMRHKLAHWMTSHWHRDGPLSDFSKAHEMEVRLIPHYWSAKNLAFIPDDTIRLPQIEEFIAKCQELTNDLVSFAIELQTWIKEAEERGDILERKIGREDISPAEAEV